MRCDLYVTNPNGLLPTGTWIPGNCPVWVNRNSFTPIGTSTGKGTDASGYVTIFDNDPYGYYSGSQIIFKGPNLNSAVDANGNFVLPGETASSTSMHIGWYQVAKGPRHPSGTIQTTGYYKFRFRVKAGWTVDRRNVAMSVSGSTSTVTWQMGRPNGTDEYDEWEFYVTVPNFLVGYNRVKISAKIPIIPPQATITYKVPSYMVSDTLSDPIVWAEETLYIGNSVTLPVIADSRGCKFYGWFTSDIGGSKVGNGGSKYSPISDTTLYGKWGHYLYFDGNGGTLSFESKLVYYLDVIGDFPVATREGYSVKEWLYYLGQDHYNGTPSNPTDLVTDTPEAWETAWGVDKPTLVVFWTPNYGVLIFDPCGGLLEGGFFRQISSDYSISGLPTPVWEGHSFLGWYTAREGGEKIVSAYKFLIPFNGAVLTAYARWDSITPTYTLTLNATGGYVAESELYVEAGTALGYLPIPSKGAATFLGWFTSTVGGERVTESSIMPDDDWILYAQWEEEKATITFDANGGSSSVTSKSIRIGAQYGKLPTAYRNGYQLVGWFTSPTGGAQIQKTDIVRGSRTLYAHWTEAFDWWEVIPIS
jgi:uncharacterized repeat protein (TIGR02543 family)